MKTGLDLIKAEREKQIRKWGLEHDKQHSRGEIAEIAAALCLGNYRDRWGLYERHPDRKDQLVIAGALIAAEIDRLQSEESGK